MILELRSFQRLLDGVKKMESSHHWKSINRKAKFVGQVNEVIDQIMSAQRLYAQDKMTTQQLEEIVQECLFVMQQLREELLTETGLGHDMVNISHVGLA